MEYRVIIANASLSRYGRRSSAPQIVASTDRLLRGFLPVGDSLKDPTFRPTDGLLDIINPLLQGADWVAGVHAAAQFNVPLAETWFEAMESIREWLQEANARIDRTAGDRAEALHVIQQCVDTLNKVRDEANRRIEENKDAGLREGVGQWHVEWSEPAGRSLSPPTLPPESVEANLLLLGDLHLGADDFVAAWDNLFRKVLCDLDLIEPKIGKPWDVVVLVGDLVHSGDADQFRDVDGVIGRLWARWQKKKWSPRLLAVPGNHDLLRPQEWSPARECLASLHEKPKQIASALWAERTKNDNKELRKFINERFKNYQGWWNSHVAEWPPGLANRDLPGEFVATLSTTSGMKLGIMGLNSAVLHFHDVEKESPSLWIDERQLYREAEPSGVKSTTCVSWSRIIRAGAL